MSNRFNTQFSYEPVEGRREDKYLTGDEWKPSRERMLHLWHNEFLCDIILTAEDKQFAAHKIVLASNSPYFEAMLRPKAFTESKMSEIPLLGITALGLEAVLKHFYEGDELILTEDTVGEVLEAADMFQCDLLAGKCADFMDYNCNQENCLIYANLLVQFGSDAFWEQRRNIMDKEIAPNFLELSTTADYLDSAFQVIYETTFSQFLQHKRETDIFRALERWLTHKIERRNLESRLLGRVEFRLMTKEELVKVVIESPCIRSPQSKMKLNSAIEYHDNKVTHHLKPPVPRVHKYETALVIIGGNTGGWTESAQLETNSVALTMDRLEPPKDCSYWSLAPGPAVSGAKGVVIGWFLFMIGGTENGIDNTMATMHRYHGITNEWVELAPMTKARADHIAEALDNNSIVVMGGRNNWSSNHSSTEIYSLKTNEWSIATEFPMQVAKCASCVTAGDIYVTGGELLNCSEQGICTARCNRVFVFNRTDLTWTEKVRMNNARMGHCMIHCDFQRRIYVYGGVSDVLRTEGIHEYFDLVTEQWISFRGYTHTSDWPLLGVSQTAGVTCLDQTVHCIVGGVGSSGTRTMQQVYSLTDEEQESARDAIQMLNIPQEFIYHCSLPFLVKEAVVVTMPVARPAQHNVHIHQNKLTGVMSVRPNHSWTDLD